MEIQDVLDLIADDKQAVDRLIQARLASNVVLIDQISHYIINSGGKRLRPVLVLLAARALGYQGPHHIDLAAVIEFIHTATLLHDDVVDASELRRGRQSANAVFGNEASVLVGDFLYSRAFQMMVGVGSMRVMQILSDATNTIAEGEVLQLLNCHDPDTTEQRYMDVIHYKTAKLFEAASQLGAVLAGRPEDEEQAMARYGMHLGTAFQLVDDVLDYSASSEQLGKNIGDDLAEGKPTLPLIYAMRHGTPEQAALIRHAIENGGRENMAEITAAIESTGAIAYTSRSARQEADRALAELANFPDSPYKQALAALAEFSVARAY
ncbi:MAG: octaprenyl diphosphate synthase [Gammaproteobacteria bacterium HGW-Gammaproteobacteria-1]|jgi:octaprenyl-diphosphate synthase|nr:MAG: octaprenyl diphosphate synthase [Gammaproteobacteria bacterium HGW-Gammaproteobacteria-1]